MDPPSQNLSKEQKLELFVNMTIQCYKNVRGNRSEQFIEDEGEHAEDGPWCPRTFDGFACWDPAPAPSTAVQPCPGFIVGFDPRRLAYKKCLENGTWFALPGGKRPWTNYTTCIDMEDLGFRNVVNEIYVIGYAISVVALILSMLIFVYFRTLHCTRIRIHMHLFTSFTLNALLWITWYKTVVSYAVFAQENSIWCQLLHLATHYAMVCSYMWMFCEALHLHIALIVVFIRDKVAMRWFMCLGWVFPMILIAAYAIARIHADDAIERCWMDPSDTFWIISIPVVISLIASFVFLVNIVRVLITKLPAVNHHTPAAVKKAVRATLILIPLFGLHFVLIPLRPAPDSPGEKIYQLVSAVLTSFQGVCVAILFCFTNHDVLTAARTHFQRRFNTNEALPMTGLTAGESVANTRDNAA
ncbi:hypothetical protein JYU34_000299 [Plutella xylostella]|uniref:Calcitonin receptor n=1 Tax=Plutella xylostella TaxID=51655 RepID=A0ABQ7R7E7_PLUXY|nr:calcitonin gene-related peptide type 1 receptor [Plutella xylostella]KAG7313200.1 hypothetical protein JYU34_000299 [Plutella xylostella]